MSYAIYVGGAHTRDGVAFLAGYGDEPSSHWLELIRASTHPEGSTITVGVTPEADLPGRLSQIPQAGRTAAQCRVSYSFYKGTPAPLTNGGLNEHGVAVRDVWSPSRPELVAMTPPDQTGPNYSDLARIVLDRARTARDGVELIGRLIAEHGHSSYGGNSHLIADATEAWVVIQFAGGLGLWAAERLGPGSIRVSRPGYIGEVPPAGSPDHLWSANFIEVAIRHGWYRPGGGRPFDVNAIYGDGKLRWEGVRLVEEELARRSRSPGKIDIHDMIDMLRDARFTGDSAGYGQVVPLLEDVPSRLRLLWHAHVGPVTAPFTPVFLGVGEVPEEYRQHRYLTEGEARVFIDRRRAESRSAVPQAVEATRSATEVLKRLQYLALHRHEAFLPEVQALWTALERRLAAELPDIGDLAALAIEAGRPDLAERYLTRYAAGEMARALDMAEALARSLEIRARLHFGLKPGGEPSGPEQIW